MFTHSANHLIYKAFKSWTGHAQTQLGKGGVSLFAYIPKQDKAYMNVDVSSIRGGCSSPTKFLDKQVAEWGACGGPDPIGNEHAHVAVVLSQFEKNVLKFPTITRDETF